MHLGQHFLQLVLGKWELAVGTVGFSILLRSVGVFWRVYRPVWRKCEVSHLRLLWEGLRAASRWRLRLAVRCSARSDRFLGLIPRADQLPFMKV